jgi:hypothetical protein
MCGLFCAREKDMTEEIPETEVSARHQVESHIQEVLKTLEHSLASNVGSRLTNELATGIFAHANAVAQRVLEEAGNGKHN